MGNAVFLENSVGVRHRLHRRQCLGTAGCHRGTYGVTGGSYRIQVKQGPDGLLVVEPNKTSPYTRRAHMASDPGRIDVEPKARYLLLAMVLIP